MPIGQRVSLEPASGPSTPPRSLGGQGLNPLLAELDAGQVNMWEHYAFDATAQGALIQVQARTTDIRRLKIVERSGSAFIIGLDRSSTPQPGAGGYDLVHPGLGELDESIPPTRVVTLVLDTGAVTPTKVLDVYLLAGVYAARTS